MPEASLPTAGTAEFLRWMLRRRRRYRVAGESMLPLLKPGQVVFVATGAAPRETDVVCATHPNEPTTIVIKRVAYIDDDGRLFLRSDNPRAQGAADSQRFGLVDPAAILGVVTSVVGDH